MATSQRRPGASAPRFVYKPRDAAVAHSRLDKYKSGSRDNYLSGDVTGFTPKEGDNWVRILPPTWNEPEHYAFDLYIHYDVGPDNNAYLCVEKMADAMERAGFPIQGVSDPVVCPLCEELRRAQRAGKSKEEYGRALESSLRLAAWIINRDEAGKGVCLWQYPPTNDREILEQCRDRRTGEILSVDHPQEGYDLEFVRKGTKMNTKYLGFKLGRKPEPVEDKYIDFVVENPIPKLLQFYSFDHITAAFAGPAAVARDTPPSNGHDAPAERGAKPEDIDERDPPMDSQEQAHMRDIAGAASSRRLRPAPENETAAAPATSGSTRRRTVAPGPAVPDFSKYTINQALDWSDEIQLEVPDSVPDEEVPAFVEAAVKKLPTQKVADMLKTLEAKWAAEASAQ